jgi:hypothetical protein
MNAAMLIKNKNEGLLLILILLVAAALRFYYLGDTSLSNDELSSIVRAQYSSFHDLYNEGIKTDVHPAGLQVFLYYWTKIAGTSPFAVRLPFAIAGVLSVLLVFIIARRWFNPLSALFAASAMAALQFPLLYSQVARMYSLGLLFCLLNIWYWSKLLMPVNEREERRKVLHCILYIVTALAAMYLHYFSLMFTGIVAFTGLFFLNRKNYIAYILSWIIILILYVPAIPLFLEQIKLGGLEDWLAQPGSNTIILYLFYCFNNSEILTSIFIAFPVLTIVMLGAKTHFQKFQLIALGWFIVPYIIIFYYSIFRQPVLQYSGLLFSFPMLILFIFSFLPERKLSVRPAVFTILFLIVITVSTVAEAKYYSTPHFGVFKELAEKAIEWDKKYGEKNITKIFTFISPKYIDYYFSRMNKNVKADLNLVYENKEIARIQKLIDTSKTEYLLYAWSNARHNYETLELITGKYPVVSERDSFFNSEITLFRKDSINETVAFDSTGTFKEPAVITSVQKEFKVILYKNLTELNLQEDNTVTAEVSINSPDSLNDVTFVIGYENFGENLGWNGMPVKYFYTRPNEWRTVILCAKVPDDKNGLLKVYIWNPSKRNFTIGDFKVQIKKTNPLYRTI